MGVFGDPNNNDLSVIDLATNTVVATVPVGTNPQGVTVNPAGTKVYVANTGSNDYTVIDTTTYESTTISGPGGVGATGTTVHPDGTRIYIANPEWMAEGENSTVWVLDRATNTIIDEISCGIGSCGVAVHPDGTVAYVSNALGGTVAVFDTATHEVVDTIVLETVDPNENSFPVPIIMHPAGTHVYAANRQGPTFWAIDTKTHEFIALAIGHSHVGIGVNPEGTAVYLPDMDDRDRSLPPQGTTVDVIDTKTLRVIATIQDVNAPVDVAVHPDGTRIYVTNSGNDTVSVVDTTAYTHIATVAVGVSPNGYGEFIGPGVPLLLKEDTLARLEAVKGEIEEGADGIIKPEQAVEYVETAITSVDLSLRSYLWSAADQEQVDPRRLHTFLGDMVFWNDQTTVEAILDAVGRGWITNAEVRSELLAIISEVVRADRVLAAVAIDDAIVSGIAREDIGKAYGILEEGDALIKEAAVWEELDKKASLLSDAIGLYQSAWGAALDLVE